MKKKEETGSDPRRAILAWPAAVLAAPSFGLAVLFLRVSARQWPYNWSMWLLLDLMIVTILSWLGWQIAIILRAQREHGTREGWILVAIGIASLALIANGLGVEFSPWQTPSVYSGEALYIGWTFCLLCLVANSWILKSVRAPFWAWLLSVDFLIAVGATWAAFHAGSMGTTCILRLLPITAGAWAGRLLLLNAIGQAALIGTAWRVERVSVSSVAVPAVLGILLFLFFTGGFSSQLSNVGTDIPYCPEAPHYLLFGGGPIW